MFKVCSKCKETKNVTEFNKAGKNSRYKDGLFSWCKLCVKEYHRLNYIKNKESILNSNKKWRDANKDEMRVLTETWRNRNQVHVTAKRKDLYWKNHEAALAAKRDYYKRNRDERYAYHLKWNKENKERIAMQRRTRENNRRLHDVNFKIKQNVTGRIRSAIKNNSKSSSSVELLGCSIQELRLWLESWFLEPENKGMNWENYGKDGWHIDHILPCSAFELQYSEEQEVCFHYTNLQPLWWNENLAKSDKILEVA